MAYGINVLTTNGLQNVRDIRGGRLIYSIRVSGRSGSVSAPDFDSARGEPFCFTNDLLVSPVISFDNSAKILSWSPTPTTTEGAQRFASSDMTFYLIHYR